MKSALAALPSLALVQPPRIYFGPGCAFEAVTAITRCGRQRVFVVTSPSVLSAAEPLAGLLRNEGATVEIHTGVPPEPTTTCFEQLRARARAFAPDLVLAVGGGSVLDVAKLVAALHDRSEPVSQFFGIGLLSGRRTALVCVPTTAGTGSEVSPNALLFDEDAVAKKAIISPALVPDVAIVDSRLMVSLPPALTATTGIDALAHCLEAYTSRAAHPVVDLYALEGVRLIGANLAQAVANGSDLEARTAVALGSLYGGLCLGPVNTAAVHALAYPLGGEFHLAHGLSIALLLPEVVRFNVPSAPARHAALARALGAAVNLDDATAANQLPDRLRALIAACEVRTGLGAHDIPRDALPRMARVALLVTRLLKNNPREVTSDDAIRIYEAAF
jgi:alcohol dehydrogenase class IV